jgi:hypothetical protein
MGFDIIRNTEALTGDLVEPKIEFEYEYGIYGMDACSKLY